MSRNITPARRRRSLTDVDGDGNSQSGFTISKRARMDYSDDNESITDDGVQSPNEPLLPDSFRRSPQNPRSTNALPNGSETSIKKHQPGSIVRVKLINFVTYTKAEFNLGPHLNMIIGPNGTGKSTLVCAICLGLGWKTSHLGRAKDIGEFVKHGAKKAIIEIELAADPSRHDENPVITTKITREGNKTDFSISGKKTSNKAVLDLARSFSIQVDNLCQFLPQDRVVEFAALSPVDLLAQTQRAAAPEQMTIWHEDLKSMRKEQKQKRAEEQASADELKNMEKRQRDQEPEVERLRERSHLDNRHAALIKFRPLVQYAAAKQRYMEAKDHRKSAEKELRRLQRQTEPNLRAVNAKEEYVLRIAKTVDSRQRLVTRSDEAAQAILTRQTKIGDKINECEQEIAAEKNGMKKDRAEISRLEGVIAQLNRQMQTPPEPFDPAEINQQYRDKTAEIREIESKVEENKNQAKRFADEGRQREADIERFEMNIAHMQSQAGQQENKLRSVSAHAAQAWDWIQKHRDEFESPVFGPPLVECSIKDQSHAAAVESMIPRAEMFAFTVTSQNDFRMLQEQLYGTMKLGYVNIRTSTEPLSRFASPCSKEELHGLGLQAWIIDLIDGPEPVLAMLCDNRMLHQTGFTANDVSSAQFEALKQHPKIGSWTTRTHSLRVTRRREYGDSAVSTRVTALQRAMFFTDAPVDRQEETEIKRQILEKTDEIQQRKDAILGLKAEWKKLEDQREILVGEADELKEFKRQKQMQLANFNGLPVKRDTQQRNLDKAHERLVAARDRMQALNDKSDDLALEKGQLTLDYAHTIDVLRGLYVQLIEAEILHIEAKSDLTHLQARSADELQLVEQRKGEVERLTQETAVTLARAQELKAQCDAQDDFDDFETIVFEEVRGLDPEQLETEIETVQARLDMTEGASNTRIIQEFEERAKKIEQRQQRLSEVEASIAELQTNIEVVMQQWEPQLDELIGKISEAFSDNFSKIQCAGEVVSSSGKLLENSYEKKVNTNYNNRETESMSVLDNHRQSGGERAVSTIFYLMALQSLARAPFRVVDEINQGMDPRNERLVHSRMVDIACGESSASQYFLITPKLLNNLVYHREMKVHCIASGEYMPEDHRDLDFGALAKKALGIRGMA
ncbi:Hypothetical protein R9X50_00035700 [Acrodontium crateriforme]|uniref:Structural maintenance of chromosomes protein 5 n=1 Tax=Acrodontium crateriforme TaxID=150365 RepID=A0AAQ3LXB4_9PEZI|nr:Hypothetical protein R9X50_00035700 [Acrodontium crateriforme]